MLNETLSNTDKILNLYTTCHFCCPNENSVNFQG